jgi:hypothetical protein
MKNCNIIISSFLFLSTKLHKGPRRRKKDKKETGQFLLLVLKIFFSFWGLTGEDFGSHNQSTSPRGLARKNFFCTLFSEEKGFVGMWKSFFLAFPKDWGRRNIIS